MRPTIIFIKVTCALLHTSTCYLACKKLQVCAPTSWWCTGCPPRPPQGQGQGQGHSVLGLGGSHKVAASHPRQRGLRGTHVGDSLWQEEGEGRSE